jgi:3-methyladenine DNA glycosylase AlkD
MFISANNQMKLKEAEIIGKSLIPLLKSGELRLAYEKLAPILAEKVPFPVLERLGQSIGIHEIHFVNPFLSQIASQRTMGGWVIIGGALREQLDRDFSGAFERAKKFIRTADIWYGTDILGERVPGPGLVSHFEEAISLLEGWRKDNNRWVRRAVGVACHFWSKRSKGDIKLVTEAEKILELLEPLFCEWDMDAVKGIGWGIKTLGKYYPDLVVHWLPRQLVLKHRAILYRKAVTYLNEEQQERIKKLYQENS